MTTLGRRPFLALAFLWAEAARAGAAPALLDVVCDLTLPGARAAGVPSFLVVALSHRTLGAVGDESSRLGAELDKAAGSSFLSLLPASQSTALSIIDTACFAPGPSPGSAWPVVKALIVAGYYSSEIGGAHDQRYELVPGRYDADISYHAGEPALSNDWAGVAFR